MSDEDIIPPPKPTPLIQPKSDNSPAEQSDSVYVTDEDIILPSKLKLIDNSKAEQSDSVYVTDEDIPLAYRLRLA